jgi:DNA-binding response OmpR family regulator
MVVYWLTQEGYTTEPMTTGPDGLQLLRNFNFDLIILDWELPGMSGYEVMEKFRQAGGNTPIIFLTGRTDIESNFTSRTRK